MSDSKRTVWLTGLVSIGCLWSIPEMVLWKACVLSAITGFAYSLMLDIVWPNQPDMDVGE